MNTIIHRAGYDVVVEINDYSPGTPDSRWTPGESEDMDLGNVYRQDTSEPVELTDEETTLVWDAARAMAEEAQGEQQISDYESRMDYYDSLECPE